jgi:hypothetical protein
LHFIIFIISYTAKELLKWTHSVMSQWISVHHFLQFEMDENAK